MTDETKLSALDRAREEVELCQKVFGADRNGWTRAGRALAALVAEIDAAPVVKVRGKTGEFATIVVSHDMIGQRVRLVSEEHEAKGGGNLPPPLDSGCAGEVGGG